MKIAPRAEIAPEFIPAMIQAYTGWMTLMNEMAKNSTRRTMDQHAISIGRLMPIIKSLSPDLRSGLDYEITRLRGLKYTKFELHTHGKQFYLAGTTKHITITMWSKRSEIKGELGQYWVAIPLDIFVKPDLGRIHMIPLRNPQSVNRHPHHYTRDFSDGREKAQHPLDRMTGNCYGSYSGPLVGLLADPDLPALFQQLSGHLQTYGESPPRSMGSLDFNHDTPEAK